MRLTILLLFCCITLMGCISSDKNSDDKSSYQNLVTLNFPQQQKEDSSVVYIDSVHIITRNKANSLMISGSFPDGCTQLKQAEHNIADNQLNLTLKAWRDSDKMCTQALTPFSFIYDKIDEGTLSAFSSVTINDRIYPIQQP